MGGKPEVLLVGGDTVTSGTTPVLARNCGQLAGDTTRRKTRVGRTIASVVPIDGLIIACAPKSGPITAIKDGGSGDVTATRVAWRTRFTSDVCVPLAYNGNLYVLVGDRKRIICVDPASGKEKWSGNLGGNAVFRASPTGADGKIYCINERGDVWVLAADHFQVLSNTSLGGSPCRATIAVADAKLFEVHRVGEGVCVCETRDRRETPMTKPNRNSSLFPAVSFGNACSRFPLASMYAG